jgi:hypothetical protein
MKQAAAAAERERRSEGRDGRRSAIEAKIAELQKRLAKLGGVADPERLKANGPADGTRPP